VADKVSLMKRPLVLTSHLVIALALVLGAGAAPAASADDLPAYTLADLGTLGGVFSAPTGINTSGQVVGYSETADGPLHAFLWSGGTMQDLGTPGLSGTYPGALGPPGSIATGINTSGQIVGYSFLSLPNQLVPYAFLYSDGVATELSPLISRSGIPLGINASGQIVGQTGAGFTFGVGRAFLYSNGTITDLGTLGRDGSIATGVNDSGQVVGYAYLASFRDNRAFLYSNETMTDLGALGEAGSRAHGINASGQVVGDSSTVDFQTHAFVYTAGAMTDLGTLGGRDSSAYSIDASGQIVGDSLTADNRQHAFLYSDGTMQDLNHLIPADSGWELIRATGINDAGQIVGYGRIGGQTRAFLLTPPSPSDLIGDLIGLVQSFNLPQGIENSLIVKLQNAQNSLAAGDTAGACDKLAAFVNQVNAQAGKALTVEQANLLIAGADQIKAALGCQ